MKFMNNSDAIRDKHQLELTGVCLYFLSHFYHNFLLGFGETKCDRHYLFQSISVWLDVSFETKTLEFSNTPLPHLSAPSCLRTCAPCPSLRLKIVPDFKYITTAYLQGNNIHNAAIDKRSRLNTVLSDRNNNRKKI